MNTPFISVIMNCYNSDTYLKEAIDSVVAQTYDNFELIFWDNQSTDKSAKIAKSYNDQRIKYHYAEQFTPLGRAKNLAIAKAKGEWIAFLDADDVWHKDKLKKSIYRLMNHPNKENVSLIYTITNIINNTGDNIGVYDRADSGSIHDVLLKNGNFIVQSSIMTRLETLLKVDGIDPTLRYCPDYDLLLKITKNHLAIGVDEFLTYYRVHDNSITYKNIYDNNIEVVEFLERYVKKNKLSVNVRYNILIHKSYRVCSLFLKLLLKNEFEKVFSIIIKYFYYFLLFPLVLFKFFKIK